MAITIAIGARTWGEQGGIGIYTRSLIRAMLAMDQTNNHHLFYARPSDTGQFAHRPNVREHVIRAPGKLLWDQIAMPRAAAHVHADVLFHPKLAVPLLTGCKTVMTVHGSERFVHPEFSTKSDLLYFRTLYPLYLKKATAILTVSENTRKDLIRHIDLDPEKIFTVHLAPGEIFQKVRDTAALQSVRDKYRLPQRFILNVGLLYPGKNLPNLLRAFQFVRQSPAYDDVKLVIVGTGRRMYQSDMKMIDTLGLTDHVLFPGYIPQDELPAVYSLAQLLAFPSYYESFGLPILEAMRCECPVVTSQTGGVPEVAGEAAFYVDPRDAASIADGINRVLVDASLRQQLVDNGLKNAGRFSWEKTARETLSVLTSLVA